jgi:hypothetical protein
MLRLESELAISTLVLKEIYSEMISFQQHASDIEQSCFHSGDLTGDLTETLMSAFETLVAERILSSECLACWKQTTNPHLLDFTEGRITANREKELTLALTSEPAFKTSSHSCLRMSW